MMCLPISQGNSRLESRDKLGRAPGEPWRAPQLRRVLPRAPQSSGELGGELRKALQMMWRVPPGPEKLGRAPGEPWRAPELRR
eukprot:1408411-Alexandrium_andersonii.AAC.1